MSDEKCNGVLFVLLFCKIQIKCKTCPFLCQPYENHIIKCEYCVDQELGLELFVLKQIFV